MKLHNGHVNSGTMSLILVAFRSQEPVWSCAPRFMLPHLLELKGKVCRNREWWRGVTARSCPPGSSADPELECSPSLAITYPLYLLLVFLGRLGFGGETSKALAGYFVAVLP